MPTWGATRAPSPGICSRTKRSRPRRGWTSARTEPTATCASPTREAWKISRKLLGGLRGFAPRLDPHRLEQRLLGEHLVRVARRRLVQRAVIDLERGLGIAEAAQVLPQDLGPDQDVDLRLEQCLLAAVRVELLRVVLRDDLHEAARPDKAFRDRVVARLDRHHREDEQRIERVLLAGAVGD